jgi:hypothetical protein
MAHLLGKDSIYGLNIQTLLLSWQQGLTIESLAAGFASHAMKKFAAFSA